MGVLFRIIVPLAVICGVLQLAAWLRWRDRALGWWAASDWVGIGGAALLLGRGILPAWAGQTLGNAIIFGVALMIWQGFRSFAGQPQQLRGAVAATLVYLVVFESCRQLSHDLGVLILLSSLALGLANAVTALDLAKAWPGQALPARSFLVWLFALHALFYLFRCVTAVTVEAGADFLATSGVQTATLLLGLVKMLIWNGVSLWIFMDRRRGAAGAEVAA